MQCCGDKKLWRPEGAPWSAGRAVPGHKFPLICALLKGRSGVFLGEKTRDQDHPISKVRRRGWRLALTPTRH